MGGKHKQREDGSRKQQQQPNNFQVIPIFEYPCWRISLCVCVCVYSAGIEANWIMPLLCIEEGKLMHITDSKSSRFEIHPYTFAIKDIRASVMDPYV